MARQEIDLTTPQPGGRQGEPTASAWEKVNDMTLELYAGLGSSSQVGGKNMLINCGTPINQRGFAGGPLAAGSYGYDRWMAGPGGCNVTINSTTGVFTHTAGSLQQPIESPPFAWGQPLTLSVENPSGDISVSVGGANGVIPAGSGRQFVTLTPTGSGNMVVEFFVAGVTYSRPQLERGTYPTNFDFRPFAFELMLCQRYFESSFPIGTAPAVNLTGHSYQGTGTNTSVVRVTEVPFKVVKRIPPEIVAYTDSLAFSQAVGAFSLWNGSVYNVATFVSDLSQTNIYGMAGSMSFGSGITLSSSYFIRGNWTADAEIY